MTSFEENPVKGIIEGDFDDRIHALTTDACSFDVASGRVDSWRQQGGYTVFNAGTFDILTLNHILGLVQCRVLGAMSLAGIAEIGTVEERQKVQQIAASDAVRLMVTLDTNRALEEGKSRRPDKGGGPKPTLDWRSRAMMLAMQSIPGPGYDVRRNAVDFITRHGPECCMRCQSGTCTNEDNALMTVGLQPDLVVVNADSHRTVRDLTAYKDRGLLSVTEIAVIKECDNQYEDVILGGPIKTTAITTRIRS